MAAKKKTKAKSEESQSTVRNAKRLREKKEVTTKLRNLSPVAQAEVMNEVIQQQVGKQLNGFTDFLREQSVIGIGIGLVLGTQLKSVVDSVNNGLVLPLTQLVLPNQKNLADQALRVHIDDRSISLGWGGIVYALFNFIVVALIIYAIFKIFKLDRLSKKK